MWSRSSTDGGLIKDGEYMSVASADIKRTLQEELTASTNIAQTVGRRWTGRGELMSGKCRPSLRKAVLEKLMRSSLGVKEKECIQAVFERYEDAVRCPEGRSLELYLKFREELDRMCVPVILESLECIEHIVYDGKTVGIVGGNPDYIDIVYVLPEYRLKGLAERAVREWYRRYGRDTVTTVHIINNNAPALRFWHKLFDLEIVARNEVDSLYVIARGKFDMKEKKDAETDKAERAD